MTLAASLIPEKGRQASQPGAKSGQSGHQPRNQYAQKNSASAWPKTPETSSSGQGNNVETVERNNLSAESAKVLAFTISQRELTDRVQAIMLEYVKGEDGTHFENAAKRLANDLECSVGTAKNYLEGRTTPQGIHDARAMAVIPGYLALKIELAGLEATMDPRHQKKISDFARFCAQQADALFNKGDE